jgi:hypothetical protein
MIEWLKGFIGKILKKDEERVDEDVNMKMGVEEKAEQGNGEYTPEDIIIKFRKAPGEEPIDVNHDFCHIPSEDEIKDAFGPGQFSIYARDGGKGRPKQKRRLTIGGNPLIPVKTYEVRVRIKDGGKLLNPNVTFPGPKIPSREDIINSLNGGGFVKLNALDLDGKIVWTEWRDYTEVPPSPSLASQEESFEGRIRQRIEEKKQKAEDEVLAGLSGEPQETSKIDVAVNRLIGALEDKKLERLEGAIVRFGEKLANPEGGNDGKESGLTELAFKKPYETRTELLKQIITEQAKTDPEKALRMLDKTPDGITMMLKLGTAAAGLVEIGTEYFKTEMDVKKREMGKKVSEDKDREKEIENTGKSEIEEEIKKRTDVESKLKVEETEEEGGFCMKFDVKGEN